MFTDGTDGMREPMPHSLRLEGREQLAVSGVIDVESFDENAVTLYTSEGLLAITGEGMHVEKLDVENGELSMTGRVISFEYEDGSPEKGGFFSRLFG